MGEARVAEHCVVYTLVVAGGCANDGRHSEMMERIHPYFAGEGAPAWGRQGLQSTVDGRIFATFSFQTQILNRAGVLASGPSRPPCPPAFNVGYLSECYGVHAFCERRHLQNKNVGLSLAWQSDEANATLNPGGGGKEPTVEVQTWARKGQERTDAV